MEWFGAVWALAAIKQAASLSNGTGNSLDLICIFFVVIYLYRSSIITKDEVFDRCVMILSAILGVRPYTAIMKKIGKMWILACCQVSQLVPASVWWIFCSCEWSWWNTVKGLEVFVLCLMCMRIWFWGVSLSSSGCAGSWFILEFISLSHVGLCFNVGCLVFCMYCSLCVFVFWCLVMSSLVYTWSLISCCDCICILSYLLR